MGKASKSAVAVAGDLVISVAFGWQCLDAILCLVQHLAVRCEQSAVCFEGWSTQ